MEFKQPKAFRILAWLLTMALILAGCRLSPLAPQTAPPALGLSFHYSQDALPAGQTEASLTVRIVDRRIQALPNSWDTARVTLSGGTLSANQMRTVARTNFNGSNYAQATITGIRPGSGFLLFVELFDGGTSGTRTAEGTSSAITLAAGPQTVTVTLAVLSTSATPFLSAIHPNLSAGTIFLEGGNFGASATVNFPGGVSAAATGLGSNRLSVAVPAGATAGNLSVTTNGSTTNALAFRQPSFALGMQTFRARNEQADASHRTLSVPSARGYHASVRIADYLYIIGGHDGTSALATVERAAINSNGTLRPFSSAGTLLTARARPAALVIGGYLYVIGGQDGTGAVTGIERAAINTDGTIGTFSNVADLATARFGHTALAIGSHLYVIGGQGAAALGTVERAAINADGTLGTFSAVSGVNLVAARVYHTCEVVGSYLYILGGLDGSSPLSSVERAAISPDGTISTFSSVGNLATARYGHTSTVLGGVLYVLGGYGTAYLSSVESATINADGTLGNFTGLTGSLATARGYHTSLVIGNFLYLFAGQIGSTSYTTDVERASLSSSGGLGTFSALSGASLITPRRGFCSATAGSTLYVIGGYASSTTTSTSSVERTTIAADGTLGPFSSSDKLVTPRRGPSSTIIDNYLYVLGGANGTSNQSSIERATINADGTLGAFSTNAVSMSRARNYHSTIVIGNYLYVIGGYDTGSLDSIDRAPINSDGTLGTFAQLPNSGSPASQIKLATARDSFTVTAIGGYLYAIAGMNGNTYLNSVERATINADGTISTFSAVAGVTLVAARSYHTSAVIGNYLYVVGGYNGTAELASVERALINADGTIGTFSVVSGVTLATGRQQHTGAILGNYFYALSGETAGVLVGSVERAILQ